MSTYVFIPQTDQEIGEFKIDGTSFEDAVDGFEFELQCHDEWKVKAQPGGVFAVDAFLKGHFVDTFLVSELSPEEQ